MLATVKNLFTVVLLLAAAAMAQAPLPDAPSAVKKDNVWTAPLKSPSFYAGVAVFSASTTYDVHSTKVCEANLTCVEAYPGHDRYSYMMPLIGLVALGTYGCEIMLHDHKKWRWVVCPSIGIGMSIIHWKDGSTIYHEDYRARP